MAVLFVTELQEMGWAGKFSNQLLHAPYMPPVAEQNIAIGASSTQSAAFNTNTRYVMLNTDTACCLAWGDSPTAVVTAQRMAANETRFVAVRSGQKLAVIAATA